MKEKVKIKYPGHKTKRPPFNIMLMNRFYQWRKHINFQTASRLETAVLLTAFCMELPFAVAGAAIITIVEKITDKIQEKKSATLKEEYTLVDGLKEGEYRSYYPNGKLRERSFFKNGEINGPCELYYPNGQLEKKGFCKDGKQDGPFEEYFENGQLRAKYPCKEGLPDGLYEEYFENGQLKFRYTYKQVEGRPYPVRDGLFEEYYENGQLKEKGYLDNGNCDGPYRKYSADGKLISEAIWRNGFRLKGERAEAYLREWKERQLAKKPEWVSLKDRLAHLTDTTYYPEIKPADTPERLAKAKDLIRVRRSAELLGKAYKEAEKSGDEELMEGIREIATPIANQERWQRRSFSRERAMRKMQSGRK